MVFIIGYAEVQGINPKVARSILSELVRLGPSPLTVQAAKIPQLRAQDREGWDRLSVAYGEAIDTLQSVCLSPEGEPEGGKPVKAPPLVEQLLDAMREHWPKGDDGRLYRFDRGKSRTELKKIPKAEMPTASDLVDGVKRWKTAWEQNGFQHNASRFISERLWQQSPKGPKQRAQQITAKPLIQGD